MKKEEKAQREYVTSDLKIEVSGCPEGWTIMINNEVMEYGILPAPTVSDVANAMSAYIKKRG